MKITARFIIKQLHLWLGLASGAVIFIVALTGCIYAFADELQNYDAPIVEANRRQLLPPDVLRAYYAPGRVVESDTIATVLGVTYGQPESLVQITYLDTQGRYASLQANPYTAAFIRKPHYAQLVQMAIEGHRSLWLPYPIGKFVVAWSVVIFVVTLLTGIVLWLPRRWTRRTMKSGFIIKVRSTRRRLIYDLHNTLGFYAAFIAILISFTGLTWSFSGLSAVYYTMLTGKEYKEWTIPVSDTTFAGCTVNTDRKLWLAVSKRFLMNGRQTLRFDFPQDSTAAYTIGYNPTPDTYYTNEYHFYDRWSLRELAGGGVYGTYGNQQTFGDKVFRMSYDIHSGSIGSIIGRIIVFLVSLICASLPVTGLLIWLLKRKKSS